MLPPLPWFNVMRLWWAIPMLLAMGLIFYGAGAEAGSTAAQQYSLSEISEQVMEIRTAMDDPPECEVYGITDPDFNEQCGEAMTQILTPAMDVFMDGYWWGMANPQVRGIAYPVSAAGALAIMAGYVYWIYRTLGWVF